MRAQWSALGLDPERAEAANTDATAPEETDEKDVEILPGLEHAWQCFQGTLTQWRVIAGFSGVFYEGIDASALLATMDMLGIEQELRAELFWQLQIMEGEARVWRYKP